MNLAVCCECGRSVPVAASDAASSVSCSCGRRVVVPTLAEFRDRPVLLSAATIERRVQRMIAEGELPVRGGCGQCGEPKMVELVNATLMCERYSTHVYGGFRFLILPYFLVWWTEESGVEIRGRDTDVPAPFHACPECRRQLSSPKGWVTIVVVASIIAIGSMLSFLDPLIGISALVLALATIYLSRIVAQKRRQRVLKELLRKVPLYRQVLDRYPRALVIMPEASPVGPPGPHVPRA
jgi:hypothetical protein